LLGLLGALFPLLLRPLWGSLLDSLLLWLPLRLLPLWLHRLLGSLSLLLRLSGLDPLLLPLLLALRRVLLLPGLCSVLPRLLWLRPLGPLLLWRSLLLLLLRRPLLLRLSLSPLLLGGRRSTLPLPALLLLLRLGLFLIALVLPCVRGDNRPAKQEHRGGTCSSSELHRNGPPLWPLSSVHADGQPALTAPGRLN
jgi:hypothetical protein